MGWDYATKLYNAELNVRWDSCFRVTMLAGFRWVDLWEQLQGTIEPSHRKSPFWDTKTSNNLCGLQLGEDWKIFNAGLLSRLTGCSRPGFSTTSLTRPPE